MKALLTAILLSVACLALSLGQSLDELVAHEQRNVDKEAVIAYGGRVGKLDAVFLIE